MKYTLTLDEKQAELLVCALDLFTRIGIGQFEEIVSLWVRDHISNLSPEQIEKARKALGSTKRALTGFTLNASYGIHSPEVPDRFRVARDLLEVIRHRLAWDKHPEGGLQVWFDKPNAISESPLATMEKDNA